MKKLTTDTQRWFLFLEYWLHRGSNCQTRDISWNINESIPVPRLSLWSLRYSFRISWTPQNSSSFERERGRIVSRHTEILVDGPPTVWIESLFSNRCRVLNWKHVDTCYCRRAGSLNFIVCISALLGGDFIDIEEFYIITGLYIHFLRLTMFNLFISILNKMVHWRYWILMYIL